MLLVITLTLNTVLCLNLYKIIDFLEDQYHRLPLWYLVSLLAGCLACFSDYDIRHALGIIVFLCLVSWITHQVWGKEEEWNRKKIIHSFLFILVLAFILGYFRAYIRLSQIDTITLEESIDTRVRGNVFSIKYNANGSWVYLKDLVYGDFLLENDWPQKIRVKIKDIDTKNVGIGDYIESYIHLDPPPSPILPGTYDFGMDPYFKNIGAYGYSRGNIKIIEAAEWGFFSGLINLIRKKLYYIFNEEMGARVGNFAAALFLGEQRSIEKNILQNMRLAGISHILCVSGMHLSLVAGMFFLFSRIFLNMSNKIAFNIDIRKLSAFISVIASFMYLMISSAGIASVRAFIMTFLVMFGFVINRRVFSLRSIAIAAFVIVMMNPEYILYPSFQLSFMASCSLIMGYELYTENRHYLHFGSSHILGKIINGIILNIYSSILATLGTGILIIYHFYIISNYVILGNLLTLPIVAFLIMPLGIIAIILMPIGFEYMPLKVMGFCIDLVIYIAEYITGMRNSVYYFGHIDAKYLLMSLFGLFWLIIWKSRIRLLGAIPMILSLIFMINSQKPYLLVNLDIGFLAFQNKDGVLEIMGRNISSFHLDFINNYYGQKSGIYHNIDIRSKNHEISMGRGGRIFIKFLEQHGDSNGQKYDKILG